MTDIICGLKTAWMVLSDNANAQVFVKVFLQKGVSIKLWSFSEETFLDFMLHTYMSEWLSKDVT